MHVHCAGTNMPSFTHISQHKAQSCQMSLPLMSTCPDTQLVWSGTKQTVPGHLTQLLQGKAATAWGLLLQLAGGVPALFVFTGYCVPWNMMCNKTYRLMFWHQGRCCLCLGCCSCSWNPGKGARCFSLVLLSMIC